MNILVAKSLPAWLMIFLEVLPKCGIAESKVFLRFCFLKSHLTKVSSVESFPSALGMVVLLLLWLLLLLIVIMIISWHSGGFSFDEDSVFFPYPRLLLVPDFEICCNIGLWPLAIAFRVKNITAGTNVIWLGLPQLGSWVLLILTSWIIPSECCRHALVVSQCSSPPWRSAKVSASIAKQPASEAAR